VKRPHRASTCDFSTLSTYKAVKGHVIQVVEHSGTDACSHAQFSQNDKANGHGTETDMHNGGLSKARTAVGA